RSRFRRWGVELTCASRKRYHPAGPGRERRHLSIAHPLRVRRRPAEVPAHILWDVRIRVDEHRHPGTAARLEEPRSRVDLAHRLAPPGRVDLHADAGGGEGGGGRLVEIRDILGRTMAAHLDHVGVADEVEE